MGVSDNVGLASVTASIGVFVIREADLKRYLRKSGDGRITETNLVSNEHGFSTYEVREDQLIIINAYGDGAYWDGYFINLAQEKGLKKVIFATRRSPRAFERKFGYKVIGHILEKEI